MRWFLLSGQGLPCRKVCPSMEEKLIFKWTLGASQFVCVTSFAASYKINEPLEGLLLISAQKTDV